MLTKIFMIHFICSAICCVYYFASVITIAASVHRENPDLKPKKRGPVAAIASYIKLVIVSLTPFLNILVLLTLIFYEEKVKEGVKEVWLREI